ncbi:MAG: aldo/keto reductase [Acidobacteria bacterium]|nr:aldo/keto reductase [Acidobacteriota bacterium]
MEHRTFGRLGWRISAIGHGLWGMGGWSGSDDAQSARALDTAIDHGVNFFDTALAYGEGRSERILARLLHTHRAKRLYVATKVPPLNRRWPGVATDHVRETFPAAHIRHCTEVSLKHLAIDCIDLQQLHVWNDAWAADEEWQREVEDLKREGLIRGFGISVNRWEPANVLKALDTGLVDAVQVVYNIFDQAPEDELFPACLARQVAVIARVPFDEGSLTGTLTPQSTWPDGDWRNIYFTPERLGEVCDRVDRLRPLVPDGATLPDMALRFILHHPAVSTTIPGMRKSGHVERNVAAGDGRRLAPELLDALRSHRWDRTATIP